MLDFLMQIVDFILMLVNLVIMLITSIVQFFVMLPQWLAFANAAFLSMPPIFVPFLIIGLSLSVILMIVRLI